MTHLPDYPREKPLDSIGRFGRHFLLAALPSAILWPLSHYLLLGPTYGEVVAFQALFGGTVSGLTTAWERERWHRRELRKRGFDPDTDADTVAPRLEVRLGVGADEALSLCRNAMLQNLRLRTLDDLSADEAAGTLQARAGGSWAGGGEQVECRVLPSPEGSVVHVHSRSRSRFAFVDGGRNLENARRIRDFLLEHAPALPPAETPPALAEGDGGTHPAPA